MTSSETDGTYLENACAKLFPDAPLVVSGHLVVRSTAKDLKGRKNIAFLRRAAPASDAAREAINHDRAFRLFTPTERARARTECTAINLF